MTPQGQVLPGKKVIWSFPGYGGGFGMFLENFFKVRFFLESFKAWNGMEPDSFHVFSAILGSEPISHASTHFISQLSYEVGTIIYSISQNSRLRQVVAHSSILYTFFNERNVRC